MNISTHKTQSTLSLSLEGTHTSETVNPTSYTRQHMHSQVKHFQQIRKVELIKFNQTDKIPTHEHLYSDQYYHISTTVLIRCLCAHNSYFLML